MSVTIVRTMTLFAPLLMAPCDCLFRVAFMVSFIGLNSQKHIFPMAIKIHLFSGPLIRVYYLSFPIKDETIQLGLTALPVTQQLALIGDLLSLLFPSFFLEWLPSHCYTF